MTPWELRETKTGGETPPPSWHPLQTAVCGGRQTWWQLSPPSWLWVLRDNKERKKKKTTQKPTQHNYKNSFSQTATKSEQGQKKKKRRAWSLKMYLLEFNNILGFPRQTNTNEVLAQVKRKIQCFLWRMNFLAYQIDLQHRSQGFVV